MHNWHNFVMLALLILKYNSQINIVPMVWFIATGENMMAQ